MRIISYALAIAALSAAAGVQAHPKLVSSRPVANATVARTGQIDLVFNEKIRPANTRILLKMTSMPGMTDHTAMTVPVSVMMGKDGKSVMVMSKTALAPGDYELQWTTSGDDRETANGSFAFKVK